MKIRPYQPPPKQPVTYKRDHKLERRRLRLAALERLTNTPGRGGTGGPSRDPYDRRLTHCGKSSRPAGETDWDPLRND